MKTILTFCFVAVTAIANAQTIIFQWAKSFVGQTIAADEGLSIAQDPLGNILVAGAMRSDIDFDPGPGSYVLNSFSAEDIFITKLDPLGNFLWAKQIVANSWDEARAVVTDAAGNVYVTGRFATGTSVDFDPGPGTFLLTPSTSNIESYILKLDPNGSFLWAQKIGGDGGDYGFGISIDGGGNIVLGGSFGGTVDFDPGPGDFSLTAAGGQAVYVLKLDGNGNFIWARNLGSASFSYGLTIDNSNNVITCGYFSGVGDFDPGAGVFNLTADANTDMFISKLDANGNFVWAKRIGGPVNDAAYGALATDAAGNVFMATPFQGTLDIDPGAAVFNITSNGNFDAMLVKLTAAGDFVWGKRWGATSIDEAYSLDTDADGNVYVGGSCSGSVDFDPGPAEFFLNGGSGDGCIVKYDNAGTFLTAARTVGNGGSAILSMLITPTNEILSTGVFGGTCDFDPGAGVFNISAPNGSDVFINKLSQQGILPLTLLDFSGEPQRNGNLLKWKTAQEINTKDFEIEWSDNGQRFSAIAVKPAAGNSNSTLQYNYLHTTHIDGDNYYRLKMQDKDGRATYSPTININTQITATAITVFPNPVVDILELNIQSPKNENITLNLYSTDGKFVSTISFGVVKGNNRYSWNLRSIATGKYFMVDANKQSKPITIIKK
ncbi:MAG: T9SS type A sorting domain-containing protein [Ginsengibacter sp.]